MFTDFYEAWWFLFDHPMFQDEYQSSQFESLLDIDVVKVNPEGESISDDDSLNTLTQVWLEIGEYNTMGRIHDIDLDCGGNTFELAIIELANLVMKHHGTEAPKNPTVIFPIY